MSNGAETVNKYSLTEGAILDKLLLVALPIMGSQVIQMAYNMTDIIWLGRVGSNAVAASGTAGMYIWVSMAIMAFGRSGSEIGVSQSLGQGKINAACEYGQTAAFLNICLGLVLGTLFFLLKTPLISFFRIEDVSVVISAENYLSIVCLGFPFVFLTASATGIYNGSGNSRLPFLINLIGLGFNMVLDPLLIFYFGLGVEGAAIATVIAQIVAGGVSAWAIISYKKRPFSDFRLFAKPHLRYLKQIVKWVTPISIETILFAFFAMLFTSMIAAYGIGALAVQRIGLQVESLSWLIAGGFATALVSFVGQNYGAGKWSRIHSSFKIASLTMALWGIVVTLTLFLGAEFIFKIFLPNETDIIPLGIVNIRILSMCQLTGCIECVALGSFRGLGRTMPPSVVAITSSFLRVVAAYFLSRTAWGLYGVWVAVTIGAVLRGIWLYTWYFLYSRKMLKADKQVQKAVVGLE